MEITTSRIEKPWGYEELVEVNEQYVVKHLFMGDGEQCSLQYHKRKKETIVVLRGTLTVIYVDGILEMKPFSTVTINPYEVHRMSAKHGDCLYLECSTPELKDTVRMDDDYERETDD